MAVVDDQVPEAASADVDEGGELADEVGELVVGELVVGELVVGAWVGVEDPLPVAGAGVADFGGEGTGQVTVEDVAV